MHAKHLTAVLALVALAPFLAPAARAEAPDVSPPRARELERDLAALRHEQELLSAELADALGRLAVLMPQLGECQAALEQKAKLADENSTLRESLATAQERFEIRARTAAEGEGALARCGEEREALRAELAARAAEAGSFRGKVAGLNAQLVEVEARWRSAKAGADALRTRLDALEKERSSLGAQLAEQRAARDAGDRAAAKCAADLEQARGRVAALEPLPGQLEQARAGLAARDKELAKAAEERERLRGRLVALEPAAGQVQLLRSELAARDGELGETRRQLAAANAKSAAELEKARARVAALEPLTGQVDELSRELAARDKELAKARQRLQVAEQRGASLAALEKQAGEQRAALEARSREAARAAQELEQAGKKREEQARDLERAGRELSAARRQLEELRRTRDALVRKVRESVSRLVALDGRLSAAEQRAPDPSGLAVPAGPERRATADLP